MMLRGNINRVLEPSTPRDYAVAGGIFIVLIPLLTGIGAVGISSISQLARWSMHGPIYLVIIACGITISSGAAIYCLNQLQKPASPAERDWKQMLRRRSINLAVGIVTLLLAFCQLITTAIVAVIIVMAIFGIAMPPLSTLQHLLLLHL